MKALLYIETSRKSRHKKGKQVEDQQYSVIKEQKHGSKHRKRQWIRKNTW